MEKGLQQGFLLACLQILAGKEEAAALMLQ